MELNKHLTPSTFELPGQLDLIPPEMDQEVLLQSENARGVCSGVNLKRYDPERYKRIVEHLASGESSRRTAIMTRTSRNLVNKIALLDENIAPLKKTMAGGLRNLAKISTERAIEMVEDPDSKIGARDLIIIAGIAVDKAQLLLGEATSVVETIDGNPSAGDFEAQAAALAAMPAADVIELDEAGAMDPGGESPPVKGPAELQPGRAPAGAGSDNETEEIP